MGPTNQSDSVIRFEGFELHPQTGELRKHGIRLNLQDQPFKVLVALLERPGEMVTREELRQLIWPEESFGDFDHAINRSIAKLRSVLGDSPDVPHLIETLPRRGYRFIGSIEGLEKAPDTPRKVGGALGAAETVPAQPLAPTTNAEAAIASRIGARRRTALIFGAFFMILLAFGIRQALPTPQPRILKTTKLTNDGKEKCCLNTDGARIYFSAFESGSFRIKQIPVTGGDPVVVSIPSLESAGDLVLQDISRDKDQLLVNVAANWANQLWSVPLSGSSPRHLIDLGSDFTEFARWSPDGQSLTYSTGHDLVLAHSDGTEPRKLFSSKGFISYPAWSPDGKLIHFGFLESPGSDERRFEEIPVTGGQPREAEPTWAERTSELDGMWTPNGKYFVFYAGQGRSTIWAVREHPSWLFSLKKPQPVRLLPGPTEYGSLAFSPDSKKIFARATEVRAQSERYDAKAGQFVPLRPQLSADCCVYSDDGQWMVYVTFPDGNLWRSRPDGTQRQQLTWSPLVALNPHLSPDGKEIAFSGFLPDKPWKTFIIPARGGEPRQLTQNDCDELEANWSPDGTLLTFGRYPRISTPACPFVVYTMDLKTQKTSTIPGSEGLLAPRWSPNGKAIVAQDKSFRTLMIYGLGSQKWSKLFEVSSGETVGFPQWSRDGKFVYCRVGQGQDAGAYRISIPDHRVKKIADMSEIQTTGVRGSWTAFDPDGNPIILRNLSLNEIYALDVDLP